MAGFPIHVPHGGDAFIPTATHHLASKLKHDLRILCPPEHAVALHPVVDDSPNAAFDRPTTQWNTKLPKLNVTQPTCLPVLPKVLNLRRNGRWPLVVFCEVTQVIDDLFPLTVAKHRSHRAIQRHAFRFAQSKASQCKRYVMDSMAAVEHLVNLDFGWNACCLYNFVDPFPNPRRSIGNKRNAQRLTSLRRVRPPSI